MTDQHTNSAAAAMEGIDETVRAELTSLRESIDNIDAAVVHMLAERFKATQRVGRLKAEHKLPPADPTREREQIARLRDLAAGARRGGTSDDQARRASRPRNPAARAPAG